MCDEVRLWVVTCKSSLRSKRFPGISAQISMFWPRENWGESKKKKEEERRKSHHSVNISSINVKSQAIGSLYSEAVTVE